ncbi:hypothetical protein [Nocardia otitidiscaviarum]|nr:hypothetical protein [Nocardia otitidiscaviarum]MBF6183345.1 hypothetical protein [Nocardia otitidiscaviarum]
MHDVDAKSPGLQVFPDHAGPSGDRVRQALRRDRDHHRFFGLSTQC